jgi:hypothetical protein
MISMPVWFVLEGKNAVSAASTGLRHAVVLERAKEPVDSD